MKKWSNPQMWRLGAEHTNAGGKGGAGDGTSYELKDGNIVNATSGPSIEGDGYKKV